MGRLLGRIKASFGLYILLVSTHWRDKRSPLYHRDLPGRQENIPDLDDLYNLYDLYDLYDLAHVAGLKPYDLHDLASCFLAYNCTYIELSINIGSMVGSSWGCWQHGR